MSQQTDRTATAPDAQIKPESILWYGYKQQQPEKCHLFDYFGGHYVWECGALSTVPMSEWTRDMRERAYRRYGVSYTPRG